MILTENGLSATVTISIGNYTRSTMKTQIRASLTAALLTLEHMYAYLVTFPKSSSVSDTGLYIYTVTNNGDV
jgi:hypothetical protein